MFPATDREREENGNGVSSHYTRLKYYETEQSPHLTLKLTSVCDHNRTIDNRLMQTHPKAFQLTTLCFSDKKSRWTFAYSYLTTMGPELSGNSHRCDIIPVDAQGQKCLLSFVPRCTPS